MRTARRSPRPTAARWGPRAAPAAGSPCTMFSGAIGFLFSSLRRLLQFWALLPLGFPSGKSGAWLLFMKQSLLQN
jgi:hypothetical protein